jgi:hypothetical protein
VNAAEILAAELGVFTLGAGAVIAARSVALAAIAAGREAVAAAREAVESGWVKGGLTIVGPSARWPAKALAEPAPETAVTPVTETAPLHKAGAA